MRCSATVRAEHYSVAIILCPHLPGKLGVAREIRGPLPGRVLLPMRDPPSRLATKRHENAQKKRRTFFATFCAFLWPKMDRCSLRDLDDLCSASIRHPPIEATTRVAWQSLRSSAAFIRVICVICGQTGPVRKRRNAERRENRATLRKRPPRAFGPPFVAITGF